jgi:hypothetical protein
MGGRRGRSASSASAAPSGDCLWSCFFCCPPLFRALHTAFGPFFWRTGAIKAVADLATFAAPAILFSLVDLIDVHGKGGAGGAGTAGRSPLVYGCVRPRHARAHDQTTT